MSKLTDRISFLKGMAAGMKLNMDKDTNKLLMEVMTVMGEMAEEMAAMTEAHNDLNEYVESIDDDLADLEETLFGDEDMDDAEEEIPADALIPGSVPPAAPVAAASKAKAKAKSVAASDEDVEEEEDDLIVYACPHCDHEIEFHASDVDFDENYLCPECKKPIFPELSEDE